MPKTGKSLEDLVATVEELLVPAGFAVERGEKRYFDSGQQEAEFDVVVRGKVGSGEIVWLIECRDRPSHGAAPGSWVEQLDGRRRRFGFNKVSAVSTTGFAESAIDAAKKLDIDLRTVQELDAEEVKSWLQTAEFRLTHRSCKPTYTKILFGDDAGPDTHAAATAFLALHKSDASILRSTLTGELHSAGGVLLAAAADQNLYELAVENGPERPIRLLLEYVNENDHYLLEMPSKSVRVHGLYFELTVRIETIGIPILAMLEYKSLHSESAITQVVSFGPVVVDGSERVVEVHRMQDHTQIIVRKITPS